MINKVKPGKLNNKGYTLLEAIIVVGITVILFALVMVGVATYFRGTQQVEMDNAAKEIFIAAQNHLSTAESQGYLDREFPGTEDTVTEGYIDKDVYYYIVDGTSNTDLDSEDSFLNLMLPYGSIDDTVRAQGSYIITYQKSTGKVLDVFYASQSSRYKHTFTQDEDQTEYKDLMANYRYEYDEEQQKYVDTHKEDRRKYGEDDAVIGYYGGDADAIADGDELEAPQVNVVNGDVLYVDVTDTNADIDNGKEAGDVKTNPTLKLIIKGKTSKANATVVLSDKGVESYTRYTNVIKVDNDTYRVILDDATDSRGNNHFASLFDEFVPGEDITVEAVAASLEVFTNVASSGVQTANSLFAKLSGGTATVSSFRHLENIEEKVSGRDVTGSDNTALSKVEQTANLKWCYDLTTDNSAYLNNVIKIMIPDSADVNASANTLKISSAADGSALSSAGEYYPVNTVSLDQSTGEFSKDNSYTIAYDGKSHTVSGVRTGGYFAGLFGYVDCTGNARSSFSNLELINFDVDSSSDGGSSAAGALVGWANYADIDSVVVRNDKTVIDGANESSLEIKAKYSAGGLAGKIMYSTVDSSAAAVYVKSTAASIANYAGGLVGISTGSSICRSYSAGHTSNGAYLDTQSGDARVNVIATTSTGEDKEGNSLYGYAGGLVGCIDSFTGEGYVNDYSTASAMGQYAGGFVGKIQSNDAVKISYSYAAGKVYVNSSNGKARGYFAGINGNSNTVFTGNRHISYADNCDKAIGSGSLKDSVTEAQIKCVSARDTEDDNLLVEVDNRANAKAYDARLIVDYEGKYTYPTIKQLVAYSKSFNSNLESASDSWFMSAHVGDWQMPAEVAADFRFLNGNQLVLEIDLPDDFTDGDKFTVAISGNKSGMSKAFIITANSSDKTKTVVEAEASASGTGAYNWTAPTLTYQTYVNTAEDVKRLYLTIDDITNEKNNYHFCNLFSGFTPGEDIQARVLAGENKVTSFAAIKDKVKVPAEDNSLYGAPSPGEIGTAYITNIRHLQNVSCKISNVSLDAPNKVKNVIFLNALKWPESDNYFAHVYSYKHDVCTDRDNKNYNYFLCVDNPYINLIDGNNCSLINFRIWSTFYDKTTLKNPLGGLFTELKADCTVKNLLIVNPIEIGGREETGAIFGKVSGNITLTMSGVVIISDTAKHGSGSAKSPAAPIDSELSCAGGLIGSVTEGAKVTINNSSVSAIVKSHCTENNKFNHQYSAGGLIGIISGDSKVTINSSYVGGHTENKKYTEDYNILADSQEVYNNNGTGGLVGSVVDSGSTLSINNSFSTASVKDSKNPSGGLIGLIDKATVTLNNAYTIAKVSGVCAEVEGGAASSDKDGGVIGKITNGGSVTAADVYFLDEIYKGYIHDTSGNTNVPYIGKAYTSAITGIRCASYLKDDGTNPISARSQGSMMYKTKTFDADLANKEYPYLVWTNTNETWDDDTAFATEDIVSDNINGETRKAMFYGDWQPELEDPSDLGKIAFYYIDPYDEKETLVDVSKNSDDKLASQTLIKNRENTFVTPAVAIIPGYQVEKWTLTKKDNSGLNLTEDVELEYKDGWITVPEEYCTQDTINVVATYAKKPDESVIRFLYDDPTEPGTKWEKAGKDRAVKTGTPRSEVNVPEKVFEDYEFEGWYTDPSFGEEYKYEFTSDKVVDKDVVLYAKYKPLEKYSIDVEFYYQFVNEDGLNDGKLHDVTTFPLYSLDIDKPVYQFSMVSGMTFDEYVDIPPVSNSKFVTDDSHVVVGKYIDDGTGKTEMVVSTDERVDDISYDATKKQFHINTDEAGKYFVVFKAISTQQDRYKVKYTFRNTVSSASVNVTPGSSAVVSDANLKYSANTDCVYTSTDTYTLIRGTVPNIDTIDINMPAGWKRITSKAELVAATGNDNVDYYINIVYARESYTFSYDAKADSPIQPVVLKYGQPMPSAPATNPTREGYTFNGWAIHDKGQDSSVQKYNWGASMPANNVVASVIWKAGTSQFRVIYWYEDADREAKVHTDSISCFQPNAEAFDVTEATTSASFSYVWEDKEVVTVPLKIDLKLKLGYYTWTTGNTDYGVFKGIANLGLNKFSDIDPDYIDSLGLSKELYEELVESLTENNIGDRITSKYIIYYYYNYQYVNIVDSGTVNVDIAGLNPNNKTGVQTLTVNDATFKKYNDNSGTIYCKYSDGSWYRCDSTGQTLYEKLNVVTTNASIKYKNNEIVVYADSYEDRKIYSWKYKNSSTGGKCIYFGGKLYNYTGTTVVGNYAECNYDPGLQDNGYNYLGSVMDSATTGSVLTKAQIANFGSYKNLNGSNVTFNEKNIEIDKDHFKFNDDVSDSNVTVAADGSTVVNVYFDRKEYTLIFKYNRSVIKTVTRKYNQDISDLFPVVGDDGKVYNCQWDDANNSYYNYYVMILDRMPAPKNNGTTITFTNYSSGNSTDRYIKYYKEVVGSDKDTTGVETHTLSGTTKKFKLFKTITHNLNPSSWYLTYDEEFHNILGFTRWGYASSENKTVQTSSNLNRTSKISIKSWNAFYYSRNSHRLFYYVSGIAEPVKYLDVQYEENLAVAAGTGYQPTTKEGKVDSDYTFDGWYKDPTCTVKIDLNAYTMPDLNFAVYSKFNPPTKNVTFYKEKKADGTYSEQIGQTLTVYKGETLENLVANPDTGDWKDEYKPTKEKYVFDGWYYMEGGTEKQLSYATIVYNDMKVYAKWSEDQDYNFDVRDITVQYLKAHAGDDDYYDTHAVTDADRMAADEVIKDNTVGTTVMVNAKSISGYYSTELLHYHVVDTDSSKNVVRFIYKQSDSWNYNVEYYITFKSIDHNGEMNGTILYGDNKTVTYTSSASYFVGRKTDQKAYNIYDTVAYSNPSGISGCHLDHYEYNGKTGNGKYVTIHPDENGTATIKYYIELDTYEMSAEELYTMYDGKTHAYKSFQRTDYSLTASNINKVELWNLYAYYSYDGTTYLDSTKVVDAGVYSVNGYVLFAVDGKAEGDSSNSKKYFLLAVDDSKDLKLRVDKRPINIKSASATKKYDGTILTACKLDDVTITGPNGQDGIIGDDKINVIFSVEAFRLNPGTTLNSFTYEGIKGTKINNYLVTTEYGELTIT